MTQPPNIREVDCCGKCYFHRFNSDCEYFCVYLKKVDVEPYNICDDFKREE